MMRRRLGQLRAVQTVQQVERDLATHDHGAACARAAEAAAAADQADRAARAAASDWYAVRAQGRFDPERGALRATVLLAAEDRVAACADDVAQAERARGECADRWRLSEARCRATDMVMRSARRDMDRRAEEAMLDLVATRWANGVRS